MKRYWRILKIAVAGKYQYMKRVHKWRIGRLFRDLQELTPYYFETFNHKYGDQNFLLAAEKLGIKSPLKNFGMMIPQQATKLLAFEANPNGVPIYAKCPSNGLCACIGKCREIIGYDTDSEKVLAYKADLARRKELFNQQSQAALGNIKWTNNKQSNL